MKVWLPDLMGRLYRQLLEMLEAALKASRLTLTEVGRNLPGAATLKAKVKRLQRQLRKPHWLAQLRALWRALAHALLSGMKQPALLVDWTQQEGHALLCCALAHDGRALPVYVEVHPLKGYGNQALEKAFLKTLHDEILPPCHPTVCTDAGFGGAFFDAIQKQGWEYLGRLQPQTMLQLVNGSEGWVNQDFLEEVTESPPEDLGWCWVAKSRPRQRRIVRCKVAAPGPSRCPRRNHGSAAKYRRQARRGWVLTTSLDPAHATAAQLIALYRTRMQIEELFRTVKDERDGLGTGSAHTPHAQTRALLWLLGGIETLVLHLTGVLAEKQGWHKHYATATGGGRRVLSLPKLGQLVLQHHDLRQLSPLRLNQALIDIRQNAEVGALAA